MEARSGNTPRSSSRSKRSTTNLANLRLAPLSTRFAEPPKVQHVAKSPAQELNSPDFARQHSSYLQGKSAPTTPGILSRSSSRRHLGGGLSRRGSLYENEGQYQYAAVVRDQSGDVRVDVGSGQIPKAKSEAALLQPRLAGHGVPLKKRHHNYSKTGNSTPRGKATPRGVDHDWLTRTHAATNALVQESKGQSWFASRDSSTALTQLDTTDEDDDEGYEEMAALSASTAQLQPGNYTLSPKQSRVRSPMWGSRYGSRQGSRRTSRRGSVTGLRTPLAMSTAQEDAIAGYFDEDSLNALNEPDFVDPEEGDEPDENEVSRLTQERSFGLGGMVDRLMNFNLFKVDEREETTEDEAERRDVNEEDGSARQLAENRRKREEKEKLTSPPAPGDTAGGEGEGGWQDAAWLLSVASKAIF